MQTGEPHIQGFDDPDVFKGPVQQLWDKICEPYRARMSDFEPLNVVGVATALILFFPPRWSALSEMESLLLSVSKDRKTQRKQAVFVDALLQSNFTERQVNADELLLYILSAFTEVRKKNAEILIVCFRSWRTAWCSLWLDVSSLRTVSGLNQRMWSLPDTIFISTVSQSCLIGT